MNVDSQKHLREAIQKKGKDQFHDQNLRNF